MVSCSESYKIRLKQVSVHNFTKKIKGIPENIVVSHPGWIIVKYTNVLRLKVYGKKIIHAFDCLNHSVQGARGWYKRLAKLSNLERLFSAAIFSIDDRSWKKVENLRF